MFIYTGIVSRDPESACHRKLSVSHGSSQEQTVDLLEISKGSSVIHYAYN